MHGLQQSKNELCKSSFLENFVSLDDLRNSNLVFVAMKNVVFKNYQKEFCKPSFIEYFAKLVISMLKQ
jgi:hypothetical protein